METHHVIYSPEKRIGALALIQLAAILLGTLAFGFLPRVNTFQGEMNLLRNALMHNTGWILCICVAWWVVSRMLVKAAPNSGLARSIESGSIVLTGLLILSYGTLIVFF